MADAFIRELAGYLPLSGGADGSTNFSNELYTPPWFSRVENNELPVSVSTRGVPTYSTARSRFGGSSARVGPSKNLVVSTGSLLGSSRLTRPSGASTFEGWFWFDAVTDCRIMGCFAGNTGSTEYAWAVGLSGGKLRLAVNRTQVGVGTTNVTAATWNHIALVRDHSFGQRLYLNGNLEVSGGGLYGMREAFELGTYSLSDGLTFTDMTGNICEVIITHTAKYPTAGFALATGPLDLSGLPSFTQASDKAPYGALRVAAAAVSVQLKQPPRPLMARDMYHGGSGKVVGDVAIDDNPDVPLVRKVWLVRMRDGQVVRETWSAPGTGAYAFVGIDIAQKYAVLAFDHSGIFNAVIADNISPEPM